MQQQSALNIKNQKKDKLCEDETFNYSLVNRTRLGFKICFTKITSQTISTVIEGDLFLVKRGSVVALNTLSFILR